MAPPSASHRHAPYHSIFRRAFRDIAGQEGDPAQKYKTISDEELDIPDTAGPILAHGVLYHNRATSEASHMAETPPSHYENSRTEETDSSSAEIAIEVPQIQPVDASPSLGHDKNGGLWVRGGDEALWLPAHRHVDIRERLLHDANQQGTYDIPRAHGRDALDYTSYLPSQKTWGVDRAHRPPWCFVYAEPLDRPTFQDAAGPMWRYGRVVIGFDNLPIKDYPDVPDTVSTQIEGYVMEEVSRKDRRVKKHDWRVRMLPLSKVAEAEPPAQNTLSARMRRFRNRACLFVWDLPRDGSSDDRAFVDSKLPARCKLSNTTWEFRDLYDHELVEKEMKTFGQHTNRAGTRRVPQGERNRRHHALVAKYNKLLEAHLERFGLQESVDGAMRAEDDELDEEPNHINVLQIESGTASVKRKRDIEGNELVDADGSVLGGISASKRAKASSPLDGNGMTASARQGPRRRPTAGGSGRSNRPKGSTSNIANPQLGPITFLPEVDRFGAINVDHFQRHNTAACETAIASEDLPITTAPILDETNLIDTWSTFGVINDECFQLYDPSAWESITPHNALPVIAAPIRGPTNLIDSAPSCKTNDCSQRVTNDTPTFGGFREPTCKLAESSLKFRRPQEVAEDRAASGADPSTDSLVVADSYLLSMPGLQQVGVKQSKQAELPTVKSKPNPYFSNYDDQDQMAPGVLSVKAQGKLPSNPESYQSRNLSLMQEKVGKHLEVVVDGWLALNGGLGADDRQRVDQVPISEQNPASEKGDRLDSTMDDAANHGAKESSPTAQRLPSSRLQTRKPPSPRKSVQAASVLPPWSSSARVTKPSSAVSSPRKRNNMKSMTRSIRNKLTEANRVGLYEALSQQENVPEGKFDSRPYWEENGRTAAQYTFDSLNALGKLYLFNNVRPSDDVQPPGPVDVGHSYNACWHCHCKRLVRLSRDSGIPVDIDLLKDSFHPDE